MGYNPKEQTVGTGECKRYFWKADREYGACILQSFADMRNHRYHGLFGAVIVEPAGAEWYENFHEKEESVCGTGGDNGTGNGKLPGICVVYSEWNPAFGCTWKSDSRPQLQSVRIRLTRKIQEKKVTITGPNGLQIVS